MSYEYHKEVFIRATPEEVFDYHTEHTNLQRITPPGIKVKTTHTEATRVGAIMKMKVTQFGILTTSWIVEFTGYERPVFLQDEMRKGPFKKWIQQRRIRAVEGGTILHDTVVYELPFGILGRIAHTLFVRRQIETMFAYRQQKTKELLENV